MSEKQYIFTFNSTHHALMFEKAAKDSSIPIIIMPVPRAIAASCGLAVKLDQGYLSDIVNLVRNKGLTYAHLYIIEDGDNKKDYKIIDIQSL